MTPPSSVCKLVEGQLCPIIQFINVDVKQYRTQYQPLGYTTNDCPPAGLHTNDHNHLSPAVQAVFRHYLVHTLLACQ